MKTNSLLVMAGTVVLAVLAAFFFLFEKYEYYDYQGGEYSEASVLIKANLYGNFKKESPYTRSAPYSLGVVVSVPYSEANQKKSMIKLSAKSLSSNENIQLPEALKMELIEKNSASEIVFSFRNMDIPYEDYEIQGTISNLNESVKPVSFSIKIIRKYHSEWRIPFWDNLMSV